MGVGSWVAHDGSRRAGGCLAWGSVWLLAMVQRLCFLCILSLCQRRHVDSFIMPLAGFCDGMADGVQVVMDNPDSHVVSEFMAVMLLPYKEKVSIQVTQVV